MKNNFVISSILLATLFSAVCVVAVNGKADEPKPAAEAGGPARWALLTVFFSIFLSA